MLCVPEAEVIISRLGETLACSVDSVEVKNHEFRVGKSTRNHRDFRSFITAIVWTLLLGSACHEPDSVSHSLA